MTMITRPESFQALRTRLVDGKVVSALERMTPDELTSGEVLVRTMYAGVNYKDSLSVQGQAKIIRDFPRVGGIEGVGVVIESASPAFRRGDKVLVHGHDTGIAFDGAYAEVMRIPAGHLQQVPEGLTALECAILGIPAFTAAMALERFEELGLVPDAGPVAVSGAGGGVGTMAIAILAKAGYEVAAITRDLDKTGELKALGATEVIDARVMSEARRPLEKARFAAAMDNVGGPVLSWLMLSMKECGAIAVIGNAAGNSFDGSVLPFFVRQLQMFGVMSNAPWDQRHRLWKRMGSDRKPDVEQIASHVHLIGLDQLTSYTAQQLQGKTSGRALVDYGVRLTPP